MSPREAATLQAAMMDAAPDLTIAAYEAVRPLGGDPDITAGLAAQLLLMALMPYLARWSRDDLDTYLAAFPDLVERSRAAFANFTFPAAAAANQA